MGRHAAAAGSGVDPVVAAALARHAPGAGPRHASAGGERGSAPVGWPGRQEDDAPAGAPVGWPGSASDSPAPAAEPAPESEPERPRGWRRLFGVRAA
ncbi:hypothetical protein [Blastococcus sp. SYSU D00695]